MAAGLAGLVLGCASKSPRLSDNVKLEENLAKLVAAAADHRPIVSAPMPHFDSIVTAQRGYGDTPPSSSTKSYARNAGPYAVVKQTFESEDSQGKPYSWNAYYAYVAGALAMVGDASASEFNLAGYSVTGSRFNPNELGSRGTFTLRQTIGETLLVSKFDMLVEQKLDNASGFEWLSDTLSAIRVNVDVNGKKSASVNLYSPKLGWTVFYGQDGKGLSDPPASRVVGAFVDGRQIGLSSSRAAANPSALLTAARPAPPTTATAPKPAAADPLASASASRAQASTVAGNCPTSIAYIEPQLPICRDHADLLELRRVALRTDVSFREDLSKGVSMRQVALSAAEATQQFDASMKKDEEAMFSMSASATMARARLDALRASPPRCDADDRAKGMSESSYQAYVAMYMASLVNRAVASIAACRARSGQ